MELHERQQFDFFLQTAVERYVERLEQWNEGPAPALARLRSDCQASTVRLSQFVDAVFDDFLLANVEGACFVLRALAARPAPGSDLPGQAVRIEAALVSMAKSAFAGLLFQKAEETLEQHAAYQPVNTAPTGDR